MSRNLARTTALRKSPARRTPFARAAVWTRVAPAFPYPVLTRFAALGLGSHLVLDLLTPRGTPLFWPLSPRQFALSWAGDTDPWLWGILAAGLAAAWAWPVRGIGMARGALAAAAAYVVFCGMARATAISRFEDAVIRLGGRPVRSEAYPRYLDPARWNVVTFGTERCWQGFVNAFGGIEGRVRTYFTPPLPARFDSAFTRAYLAWARAPVARQLAGAGLCFTDSDVGCRQLWATAGRVSPGRRSCGSAGDRLRGLT